jgi:hypothetical protein
MPSTAPKTPSLLARRFVRVVSYFSRAHGAFLRLATCLVPSIASRTSPRIVNCSESAQGRGSKPAELLRFLRSPPPSPSSRRCARTTHRRPASFTPPALPRSLRLSSSSHLSTRSCTRRTLAACSVSTSQALQGRFLSPRAASYSSGFSPSTFFGPSSRTPPFLPSVKQYGKVSTSHLSSQRPC